MSNRGVGLAITLVVAGHIVLGRLGVSLWQCPFRQATGLRCPGCGMTEAALAMLRWQWGRVWDLNPFTPVILAGLLLTFVAAVLPDGSRRSLVVAVATVERATGISHFALLSLVLYGVARML